jgi:LPXTG-motif cell wall-anchored protein
MYGKTGIVGVTGGLAATGFAVSWFIVAGSVLLFSGLLLLRWGRRQASSR